VIVSRPVLDTTITGSLPKPAWLAAPETLWAPWRLPPETLAQGQRDAVLVALMLQEAAGIDIVTDGEQSRQHFVHGFLTRIDGIDFTKRVTIGIRADRYKAEVPTVTGPLRRREPVHLDEVRWARAHTDRRLKFTLPATASPERPLSTTVTATASRPTSTGSGPSGTSGGSTSRRSRCSPGAG